MQPDAISLVLAAVVAWLAIGALGIAGLRKLRFVSRVLFPAGAGVGVALAVVAFLAIGAPANAIVLPFGLSFYTIKKVMYMVDVALGRLEAEVR